MTEIIAFTDGSYIREKDQCGYGIHYPNGEYTDISKPFTKLPKTNQRAELYAIYKVIKNVNKSNANLNIHIYTDSEYSIKSLTIWIKNWIKNGWINSKNKPVENQDIIKKINELMESHKGKIKFTHVRSHTGKKDFESINNDIVDKLAKEGGEKI
jgi:ribonuclease HI